MGFAERVAVGAGVDMRGKDGVAGSLFSYVDLEKRGRSDFPRQLVCEIVNATLSAEGDLRSSPFGRESIPPERLLRALMESRASTKSLRSKEGCGPLVGAGGFGEQDLHGEKRSNEIRASAIDIAARLCGKGRNKEAKLCFMGHALMEDRHRGMTKSDWQFTFAIAVYNPVRLPRLLAAT